MMTCVRKKNLWIGKRDHSKYLGFWNKTCKKMFENRSGLWAEFQFWWKSETNTISGGAFFIIHNWNKFSRIFNSIEINS